MTCSRLSLNYRSTGYLKSLINLARELRRLPLSERLFIAHAWTLLAGMDLAIRIVPFDRLLMRCQRIRTAGWFSRSSMVSLSRSVQLVNATSRHHFWATTCLTETLVLSRLLAGRGMATTFRIGVSRRDGSLTAHAWLEQNGAVIADAGDATAYAPLQLIRQPNGSLS